MKLTKSAIDKIAPPKSGAIFFWDDDLKGFGVRVTPSRKSYVAQGRVNGRTVRVTIGPHNPLTPDQARRLAKSHLGAMAGGIDHNRLRRKTDSQATTLGDAYDEYLKSKGDRLAESTKVDYAHAMNSAFGEWRKKPLVAINRDMIERKFDDESKKGKASANRKFRFLRALLNFAMEKYAVDGNPLIPSNPCQRLSALKKWHKIERRTRYIRPEQMKRWFDALKYRPDDSPHLNDVRDLCSLLILTGLREQEGASLRWNDVDLTQKMITIRRTKNSRIHRLPIGPWLTNALAYRRIQCGLSEFVFPAKSKQGHLVYHHKAVIKLVKLGGIDFRLHDLRRTFASVVNIKVRDASVYTIKRLLNHSSGTDVTAGYIQHDIEDLRSAMEIVEQTILNWADIRTSDQGSIPQP